MSFDYVFSQQFRGDGEIAFAQYREAFGNWKILYVGQVDINFFFISSQDILTVPQINTR